MSVTLDIARSYRAPRQTLRRRIAATGREAQALAVLMAGCVVMFVAQWPLAARLAHEDASIPLQGRLSGALMAWLIFAPLVFYALAGVAHLISRLFGGRGDALATRTATFWALLASSPLWLLNGLTLGFVGEGVPGLITGSLATLAFLGFWALGVREAGRGEEALG
jgi:hypothetical protein